MDWFKRMMEYVKHQYTNSILRPNIIICPCKMFLMWCSEKKKTNSLIKSDYVASKGCKAPDIHFEINFLDHQPIASSHPGHQLPVKYVFQGLNSVQSAAVKHVQDRKYNWGDNNSSPLPPVHIKLVTRLSQDTEFTWGKCWDYPVVHFTCFGGDKLNDLNSYNQFLLRYYQLGEF